MKSGDRQLWVSKLVCVVVIPSYAT